MVDAISGYDLFSFMDIFSGYNQIRMVPENEKKTVFITKVFSISGLMPFGLKNTGALTSAW